MVKTPNDSKCPVIINAEAALESAQNLNRTFRKLRKSLALCSDCTFQGECGILRELDSQINAALDEVLEEWGYNPHPTSP